LDIQGATHFPSASHLLHRRLLPTAPAWCKLKLTRECTFLDHASATLVPGQWYQLKVVRDGDTGLIQVYLDEGQGYPETPTLEAVDSAYPDLRRLGWAMLGSGYDLYVDWIVAQ